MSQAVRLHVALCPICKAGRLAFVRDLRASAPDAPHEHPRQSAPRNLVVPVVVLVLDRRSSRQSSRQRLGVRTAPPGASCTERMSVPRSGADTATTASPRQSAILNLQSAICNGLPLPRPVDPPPGRPWREDRHNPGPSDGLSNPIGPSSGPAVPSNPFCALRPRSRYGTLSSVGLRVSPAWAQGTKR